MRATMVAERPSTYGDDGDFSNFLGAGSITASRAACAGPSVAALVRK